MQRFSAIITLTAFLLVITLPILPVAPACAHSVMANDEPCGTACHDETPTLMPDDMDMSELDMEMEAVATQVLTKQETSSEKPPHCRIECGCGCNSSPDTFPLTLSPHLPAIDLYEIEMIKSEIALTAATHISIRNATPDSPPPRIS